MPRSSETPARGLRWVHAPLVHFLAGGALLFGVVHGARSSGSTHDPVVITADDVARLRAGYQQDTGRAPTAGDEAALVEQAIDEELLVREALVRGLDRNDRSIRNWLVEQMEAVSNDPAPDPDTLYARALGLGLDRTDLVVRRILLHKIRLLIARADDHPPTDAELAAFWTQHQDDYRAPNRVNFWHVFFARSTRGEHQMLDAEVVLATARATALSPTAAGRHGDPFATAPHVVDQSIAQVEKLFGAAFAAALADLPTQAWTGPVASAHGVHLVWIEARTPGAVPALDAVRRQLVERWRETRRHEQVAALLRDRRKRYRLDVASEAWQRWNPS